MEKIRFLANMNISPKSVDGLRSQGWDIVRVSEFLPLNASDEEILNFARQEGRVVVTQDIDFSTLLALGGHSSPSLITLRLSYSKRMKEVGYLLSRMMKNVQTARANYQPQRKTKRLNSIAKQ